MKLVQGLSKAWLKVAMLLICAFGLLLMKCLAYSHWQATQSQAFNEVLQKIDPLHPGFGPDPLGKKPKDHPMAYAMVASAAAKKKHTKLAHVSANWLAQNMVHNG